MAIVCIAQIIEKVRKSINGALTINIYSHIYLAHEIFKSLPMTVERLNNKS